MRTYDPAFAWELAILVRFGIHRMFIEDHNELFYLMMYNQALPQPPKPELPELEEGVMRGGYLLEAPSGDGPRVNLLGSGTILSEVLEAASVLRKEGFSVAVFSITSFIELARDAERAEEAGEPASSWLAKLFGVDDSPCIAATDYVRALPRMIASWVPGSFIALGTDGFGLSERREVLRRHFRVDAAAIARAARNSVGRH